MRRSFIILLHTGYWILYLALISLFIFFVQAAGIRNGSGSMHYMMPAILQISFFTILPGLIGFYFFYLLLFDRYLSQKKIALLCITGLLGILLAGFTGFASLNILMHGYILQYNGFGEILVMIAFMSLLALVHGVIALVMKGFIRWYADIKIKQQLQEKNFEAELALVKARMSPHFLFNTINNIDVLIGKDPERASAYLNKLSGIMRFMLYETKGEHIPLSKELLYIERYIELQRIRSANQHFIRYSVEGDMVHREIAPMLFIPFIENAFKHSGDTKADNGIVIKFVISPDKLDFYCENKIAPSLSTEEPGGVGNDLIQKRLSLLYPGKHRLVSEKQEGFYKVHLTIFSHEN